MLKLSTPALLALCGIPLVAGLTGCQTSVGGQTLPSAHYLRDDVQYFPAGPEFILSNSVRAIEQYNLDKSSFEGNFSGDTAGRKSDPSDAPGAPAYNN